ncbi:MAG: KilA-N domain-containing protein [Paludibacter sp.]
MKTSKLIFKGSEISFFNINTEDYISLTDIAKHKDDIIKNWLRNRNTIELLGFWEQLYNPNFKPVEFDGFRKQAGMNSFVIK